MLTEGGGNKVGVKREKRGWGCVLCRLVFYDEIGKGANSAMIVSGGPKG